MGVGGVTHPLLAALSWHLHSSWKGAVRAGESDIHGAEGHTAHSSVQTGTLVLAAALESLSTLVHHTAKHTGGSFSSCADSNASVDGGSEVTEEAFVWVTDVFLSAQLAHLLGTHPAAATAIQHQAHPRETLRGGGGARTLAAALLTCSHM